MTKSIIISDSEEAKTRAFVQKVLARGSLKELSVSEVEDAIRVNSSRYASLTDMRDCAKRVADLTGFRSGYFGVAFVQLIPFLNNLIEKGEEVEGCNFRQY